MTEKRISMQFAAGFTDAYELNETFAVAKMWVAYVGKNRNGSEIPKSTFVDALPTMAYCPVVARYDREANDFGGHDIEVVAQDDYIKFVNSTVPFGVVPENAKCGFETVVDKNGESHEYLTASVILWKRQEGYDRLIELGSVSQSMEIDVLEAHDGDDGAFVVDKMRFAAFCILGSEHEPCFEGANITVEPEVAGLRGEQYSAMVAELKTFDLKLPEQYCCACEDPAAEPIEPAASEPTVEPDMTPAWMADLSNMESAISCEHKSMWVADYDSDRIIAVSYSFDNETWSKEFYTIPYVKDENGEIQIDFSAAEKVSFEVMTEEKLAARREQEELLKSLKAYKARREAEDLKAAIDAALAKFSVLNGVQEFEELKAKAYGMTPEEIELQCYALKGKKVFERENFEVKEPDSLRQPLPQEQSRERTDKYGDLFEKYSK